MDASRNWERHWWLGLLPVLLAAMCWEYGVWEGLSRFAAFIYVGSCVLMIAVLVVSLLARVAPSKTTLLVTASIVIAYAVFEIVRGNVEPVWKGALLGLYFGLVFGVIMWFVSSRYAEKIRSAESSFYARVCTWVRGKNS